MLYYGGATAQTQWRSFGDLQIPRHFFGALPVGQTQVLVMGGYGFTRLAQQGTPLASCELIDVERRTITEASPMNAGRAEACYVMMPDSSIVALSGVGTGGVTPSCERYEPATGRWTLVGSLIIGRRQFAAFAVNSEEIMVLGGLDANLRSLNTVEILNIRTRQSRFVANFPHNVNNPGLGRTPNGDIIGFAGRAGGAGSARSPNVYRYDAVTNQWLQIGTMSESVQTPQTLQLSDGRCVISGGSRFEEPYNFSPMVHIVDSNSVRLRTQQCVRRAWHSVVQWSQDSILVIAGQSEQLRGQVETDWVNLRTGQVSAGPLLQERRMFFRAIALPILSGSAVIGQRVLAIEGALGTFEPSTSSVEILEPTQPSLGECPPLAATLAQTCSTLALTLQAAQDDRIALVTLDSSQGNLPLSAVQIQVQAQSGGQSPLPARAAQVTLTLREGQAARTGGRALVVVQMASGCTHIVGGHIAGLTTASIRIEVASGYVFSTAFPQAVGVAATLQVNVPRAVSCATFTLRNTSSRTFTIPSLRFERNGEFFAPLSRLPLVMPAGGTCAMELCFSSTETSGLFRNAVSFRTASCEEFRLPLIGLVNPPPQAQFAFATAAPAPPEALLEAATSTHIVSVLAMQPPAPHPADERTMVIATLALPRSQPFVASAIQCSLHSTLGNEVLRLRLEDVTVERMEAIDEQPTASEGTERLVRLRLTVNVRTVPSGVYVLTATVGGAKAHQRVVVRH
jgi:hypothetical protein